MSVVVDHLVLSAPSLDEGVAHVAELTGVTAAYGGAHPGMGTHNALLALGTDVYLEIIAPDPTQPEPAGGRPFGVTGDGPVDLVSFAVRPSPGMTIEQVVAAARSEGHDAGPIAPMSRARPDGSELHWQLTMPPGTGGDQQVPFVIDWGDSPNPATSSPGGCRLIALDVHHPDADRLATVYAALGLSLRIGDAETAGLSARVDSPLGEVVLGRPAGDG